MVTAALSGNSIVPVTPPIVEPLRMSDAWMLVFAAAGKSVDETQLVSPSALQSLTVRFEQSIVPCVNSPFAL